MLIIFFYFLKIIFDISTSKRSKTYKQYSILIKKIQNFWERRRSRVPKHNKTFKKAVVIVFLKNFIFLLKINFLYILNYFNILILEIIFKK